MKNKVIPTENKLRYLITATTSLLLLAFVSLTTGCNDDKAKKHYTMNALFKEYFVNFEVGTMWIYKDTFLNTMDTIKLVSKNGEGWNSKDESAEGYRLVFEAKKNSNFVLNSAIYKFGNYAALHPGPLSTGADGGTIAWGYNEIEDRWYDKFVETITFQGYHFSNVVLSFSTSAYYNNCYFGKEGLVFFDEFVLIKTIKP